MHGLIMLELIPIGTLLAIITTEVLETALAAQDVLVEKESFRTLAQYLQDIQPVLTELRKREMRDSNAVRQALEALQEDIKRARCLVDMCITKPRFYLLVNCRTIVKDAQRVTRDLGNSLQLLSLASMEVSIDIRANVSKLKDQMINTEFQVGALATSTINKLELGLREHKTDRGFANDLLAEIARAVGVPVEASEISKELASFKREKEEAVVQKKEEEEAFMEQVIKLLSRADAAYNPEGTKETYIERVLSISSNFNDDEPMAPLHSFVCPLKQDVMVDPVTLQSGHTYEREQIMRWFSEGHTKDPVTKEELSDLSVRPNTPLRQSIEEWVERNYCIIIRHAKRMLQSAEESKQKHALTQLQQLCQQNNVNKEWIVAEGLLVDFVAALKSHSREVKRGALSTLFALVKGNTLNKEKVAESGGVEQVVRCLAREISVAKAAVALLLELLHNERHGKNEVVYAKIEQERSAILLLVTLTNSKDPEAVQNAKLILEQLSDKDENVVQMAAANWCPPLITCLCQGTQESKLAMANAVAKMELTDQSKHKMAEQGAIAPLVSLLVAGNLEAKAASLGALQKLSSLSQNKSHVAEAGAVPLVLDHLFAGTSLPSVRESAAAILENLALGDGTKFLVDAHGIPIDVSQTIHNLLAIQSKFASSSLVCKHVLGALLGMASMANAAEVRKWIRNGHGISMLLPLIQGAERDARDCVVRLICCLSEEGGAEIAALLHRQHLVGDLVKLLGDRGKGDLQTAAAGILESLPLNDNPLTESLVEAGSLPALVAVVESGSVRAKENAIGALLRFTNPSNIATQRALADLNVHPLLVMILTSGTLAAKTKAAMALKNFSVSSHQLSIAPSVRGCLCFNAGRPPLCKVHAGSCEVKTTFCIVEAGALPGLVMLLEERSADAAEAAMDALATLVSDDEILDKGAQVLHESKAIDPVLGLLMRGPVQSREKAVKLLETIFRAKGMKDLYGSRARIPLVDLATHGTVAVKKKAARVLAQLGIIQEASTYF